LEVKSLLPDHTYARLSEDLEIIKKSLREDRNR